MEVGGFFFDFEAVRTESRDRDAPRRYGAGNEQVMRNDIKHGKELFKWLAPEQVAVLDEIEAQFTTEFDYRREAALQRTQWWPRRWRTAVGSKRRKTTT